MPRSTSFRFTLEPTAEQETAFRRHAGAARFAFNQSLRLTLDAMTAKETDATIKVPWSTFDQINSINRWKRSANAGIDADGNPGLPWRREVSAQVFEEAAVDLGRALQNYSSSKKGTRTGRAVRFPRFKKKGKARDSFRIRAKRSGGRSNVRFAESGSCSITLPTFGAIRTKENTWRRLGKMVAKGRAKVFFVTISRAGRRWYATVNVEAADFHPERLLSEGQRQEQREKIGIDRGLKIFATLSNADGTHVETIEHPKPLNHNLSKLRTLSRRLSRTQERSRRRQRARNNLRVFHARLRRQRQDFLHKLSTRLIKTHDRLALEDLNTAGMLRNRRLSRHIADSAWAEFGRQLSYKSKWYDRELLWVDRWFPSSKQCSRCGSKKPMPLSERVYECGACGLVLDRDENAARNLAAWEPNSVSQTVAAKRVETLNGRGDGCSLGRRDNPSDRVHHAKPVREGSVKPAA